MQAGDLDRDRLRGIAILIASASLFGAVDGISKILAETQSLGQIVLTRYALAVPVLLAATPRAEWRTLFHTERSGMQVLRACAPIVISFAMVLAVRYLPLADATAILFAGPFLVVALSAPLLGERVALSSWIGVIVGFAAVLIVARPGFSDLSRYVVFPLTAAVFYALFQLITRRLAAAGENPNTTLAWTLATGTLFAAPIAFLTWIPPSLTAWLLMIALGLVFGAAQALLVRAFRHAPANVLTPFSYTQILAATVFGMLVFGAVPDRWTLIGIALLIGAGVYVVRGQANARRAAILPEAGQ
jgi:drug/metabolite transporter (DMT)-like permease